MTGAAICLIAGILLRKAAPVYLFFVITIILVVISLIRIKFKKMHTAYIFFPILVITGYLCLGYQNKICDEPVADQVCIEGFVYNVKESDFGYQIFIRKNIFDKKRYVVMSDTYYPKGSRIKVQGKNTGFSSPTNPGEFDSKTYYNSLKIHSRIKADSILLIRKCENPVYYCASKVSDRIDEVFHGICNEKYASIFGAMVLGRKDELDNEVKDLLSSGGIGHILAISGLHISLIGMGIYKFLRKFGINYVITMIVSSGLIFFYGIMTGNGVSTIRAFIMFSVYVYANVAEKTYDMISAASLAAIVSLIDSPLLLFNCSFLLSYMAVVGIVYVYNSISKCINCQNKIVNGFVISLSIQIATLPITLYFFFRVPVFSVLLNIIVIPLMSIVMVSVILAGIFGIVGMGAGMLMIGPAVYIMKFFEWLCKLNKKINFAVYTAGRPEMFRIIAYYFLLIIIVYLVIEKKKYKMNLCIIFCVLLITIKIKTGFTIVFLDVGQGDGIFIENSDGTTFLIDCGSSDRKNIYEYILKPFLLSNGHSKLDYVIVTHCDSDHISGINEMLQKNDINVENLIMPDTALIEQNYEKLVLLAGESGIKVSKISEGMSLKKENLFMYCIHPEMGYLSNEKNDYSTTLLVKYKDFKVLLTGDISGSIEKQIIEKYIPFNDISVMKAPHHGSKNSNSEEFISYFLPDEVIISCGKDNSYGHPNRETLGRFLQYGINIRRTDELGAIRIHIK